MKVHYIVAASDNLEDLMFEVNRLGEMEYEPMGGICYDGAGYIQAMGKPLKVKKSPMQEHHIWNKFNDLLDGFDQEEAELDKELKKKFSKPVARGKRSKLLQEAEQKKSKFLQDLKGKRSKGTTK